MKKQHVIKLKGYLADGTLAKTHQAAEVASFQGDSKGQLGYFKVCHEPAEGYILMTPRGVYSLTRDESNNRWVCYPTLGNKTPVIVTLKAITGKLIYWAEEN